MSKDRIGVRLTNIVINRDFESCQETQPLDWRIRYFN